MTDTPRLGITQLEEDQALPDVVVNEATRILEAFANATHFKSRTTTAQPGSPADGDTYLLPTSSTGAAWAGHDGDIAIFVNTAWEFRDAKEGFFAWVDDDDELIIFDGSTWNAFNPAAGPVGSSGLTMSTARLLGRTTASTGAIEEITVGSGLSLAAGNLSATGGGATVDVEDEGVLEASASTLNFTGAGVTATDQGGGVVDIDIPGGGGGTAWALAGTGQTATGVYDFAVDGAKANIDFTGLGSFNELLIFMRDLAWGVLGVRTLVVSVDNGSTFFTTSGDYITIAATGVTSAFNLLASHGTNATAARSMVTHLVNMKGLEKAAFSQGSGAVVFVGSSSDINAIRVSNSGGGNSTGGTVRVFAR